MEPILAAIGLMCILKYGSIFDFIRKPLTRIGFFETLFGCSLCLGFWTGVLVAAYEYFVNGVVDPYMPFIAAAASWMFDTVLGVFQAVEASLNADRE